MFDADRFKNAITLGYGGSEENALQELQAILQASPENDDKGWIVLYEVIFLARLRRTTEARQRFAELSKLWGHRVAEHTARIGLTDALLDELEGNKAQALRKLDCILKDFENLWRSPDTRDLYEEVQLVRGRMLVDQGRYAEALPILEESLSFDRHIDVELCYDLGCCYFACKNWDKAEQWLKETLAKDPHAALASAVHYRLGLVYFFRDALARAIKELESAAEYRGEDSTPRKLIYEALAKCLRRMGLEEESKRYADLAESAQ